MTDLPRALAPAGTIEEAAILAGRAAARAMAAITLITALLAVVLIASGARHIVRDGSVDAFVPMDHPAAVARDAARDLFGIEDPVVIGISAPEGESAFSAPALEAVRTLHEALRGVDGVKKDSIQSIASEKAIADAGGDLAVDPILGTAPLTPAEVAATRDRFRAMPMFADVLASSDETMLVLIVPVEDPNHAEETVAAIRTLADATVPAGHQVHMAGVATMNAALAAMVSKDTRIFVPAALVVMLVILGLSFRSVPAMVGPLAVILGSAAVALGVMGWSGGHYYLITTALPVVVMAIAVADSVHIQMSYLKHRQRDPMLSAASAVARALDQTMLPVTLTSLTTVAAFTGIALGAGMVPIRDFGLYTAVGVVAAWLLSLTLLPAIIILMNLKPHHSPGARAQASAIDRAVAALTARSLANPRLMLGLTASLILVLAVLAAQSRFDYQRSHYFVDGDPVRTADAVLNDRLGGINALDVKVSGDTPEALLDPNALRDVAELRQAIEALPHVAQVSAIDQPIAHMHKVLTGAPQNVLPTAAAAPTQYLFLYEASAGPEDFKSQIDLERSHALVRARLGTDRFTDTEPVVRQLEQLAADWSAETGLNAEVSGRVAVNAGWMRQLADTHVRGLALAVLLVFAVTVLAFRAFWPAVMAMVPVLVGILFVYAAMGVLGIDIAPATSMTTAIATGLGIDFAIHLIAHVRRRRAEGASLAEALSGDYAVVARACVLCAVMLAVALFTICLSSAPPLRWFGVLVAAGSIGSLVGAVVMLPGLMVLCDRQPRAKVVTA